MKKLPIIIMMLGVLMTSLYAQKLGIRIDAEAGSANFSLDDRRTAVFGLAKFSGQLKYGKSRGKHVWKISSRFQQELAASLNTISFKIQGRYLYKTPKFHWSGHFSDERKRYQQQFASVNYDVFHLCATGTWLRNSTDAVLLNLGYYYRDTNGQVRNQLDAFTALFKYQKRFRKSMRVSGGVFTERFLTRILGFSFSLDETENKSWRVGQEIGFAYKKKAIINITYRWLWQYSQTFKSESNAHLTRVFVGKMFAKSWTGFFLVDYYWQANPKENTTENSILTDAVRQTENNVYAKLEKDISERIVGYLKVGYLNEAFVNSDFTRAGWLTTVGFSLRY